MITYPSMDPIALSVGPLHVHWYGVMYLLGFFASWLLARFRVKRYHLEWTSEQVSDLIFFAALGVIIGGRLGYMVFYNTHHLLSHPLDVLKLWEGGMSFHGGLLGVGAALWYGSYKLKKPFWQVADFYAPLVPLGLAAGRAGNFINGELWGRVTTMPWGMVFPEGGPLPRHPSQLYELGLEGIGLFVLVWWYASRSRPAGTVSAVFLMGYAVCRLIVECFREPDLQLGFFFDWFTMGQLLSVPMLLGGVLLWWIKRDETLPTVS